jgi:putative membrane-bound dehydrogenase-like protein
MTGIFLRVLLLGVALGGLVLLRGDEPPRTGPQTEKRFPPLQVPAGFKATLFACDPLIEYPSVIAAGPRTGALFVAIDYMTGLGTEIVRRDEVRLVEDTDGDGYADKTTVFASGFNSIQGLAYHDRTPYVMHAPYLTALRDTKGTGVADERRDLLTGLGLTPEKNPTRLHCANGVVPGHDGWLYLALGDNGIDVPRPEGDRLVLHGGGILRCRLDGRDLHVFASGLRNIYDVALDADLEVFVRDNENDGGTYMIRVCHSFHGADHGYPHLYEERPDEALRPLADLGRGSSAGGVCYLERQFPPEYRGNLLFCEWGRSLVRYVPRRAGSSFAPLTELPFAAGAANDPYGFKPTDIVVQSDGSLMVSDWADGQRPKRGRGRIYHLAYGDASTPQNNTQGLARLDSESYHERWEAQQAVERQGPDGRKALREALDNGRFGSRGRGHAVWALARLGGPSAIDELLRLARTDPESAVRAQAVRAVADLSDPVLVRHRLDAGPGDAELAARVAELGKGQDSRVQREIVIALGRLRWAGTAAWLRQNLGKTDDALAHAAQQALRRARNWPALLQLLDTPLRAIALRAAAEHFEPALVEGLIERLDKESVAERRREYADVLARVCKQRGPWVYWGYRPAPRQANTVLWERSEAIAKALDRTLADPDRSVRLAVLRRMQREKVPASLTALTRWLQEEHEPERVAVLLAALSEQPPGEIRPSLEAVVKDRQHSTANRQSALTALGRGLGENPRTVLALLQALEDGPILADAMRLILKYPGVGVEQIMTIKLSSTEAEVRAAAIEILGERRVQEARTALRTLLGDQDVRVRRAAAAAAGKLEAREASETLLRYVTDPDAALRRASLNALRQLREPRVVPLAVAALTDRTLELAALHCLAELGGPEQTAAVTDLAKHSPSSEVSAAAVRALTAWRDRAGLSSDQRQALDAAVAQVQQASGILVRWQATAESGRTATLPAINGTPFADERTLFASGPEGRVLLAAKSDPTGGWLAYTQLAAPEPTPVEFLASSSGNLQVWLNGQSLYRRDKARKFQLDSDHFDGTLAKGANRVLVRVEGAAAPAEFHIRFRRKLASAQRERLAQAALTRAGDPERGRKLFFDAEKSLCLKCHRLGEQGERFGPELTGIGGRFARIYLVESILEPSRAIAPSYGTLVVTLKNGKLLSGVKVAETDTMLTLADNQGQKHALAKADIDEQQASPVSTMPENLEQRFSEAEFVDLVAFLASQKEGR